jgi:hypothetical protein
LLLCFAVQGYTQEILSIYAEDSLIEADSRRDGFHLYIKKKPGISSIILMESTQDPAGKEDSYPYQPLEWNEVNGNEMRVFSSPYPAEDLEWYLMDSTLEKHPLLGEAFHIYVPPTIAYGSANTRNNILKVEDGIFINIRAFAMPYINYSGEFKDNPFILSIEDADDATRPPYRSLIRLKDPPSSNRGSASREPSGPAVLLEGQRSSLTINTREGAAVFFPGPEGRELGLRNEYDPVGTITLANMFTPRNPGWFTCGFFLGFDRDPVLMNRILFRGAWGVSFIGIEAGPYFGFLNSETEQISPGLSLVFRLRIPRWNIFSSFQHDTALGKELSDPGDYIQTCTDIKAGIALPFGDITLSLTDRSSTLQKDVGLEISSYWIRYNLAIGITPPRASFGFRLDLGYQRFQWSYYYTPSLPLNYTYYNIYAGLELSYKVKSLTMSFGLEAPVYPFIYPHIQSLEVPQASLFGQVYLGFRWVLPPIQLF